MQGSVRKSGKTKASRHTRHVQSCSRGAREVAGIVFGLTLSRGKCISVLSSADPCPFHMLLIPCDTSPIAAYLFPTIAHSARQITHIMATLEDQKICNEIVCLRAIFHRTSRFPFPRNQRSSKPSRQSSAVSYLNLHYMLGQTMQLCSSVASGLTTGVQ